jgi:hypothetical protein
MYLLALLLESPNHGHTNSGPSPREDHGLSPPRQRARELLAAGVKPMRLYLWPVYVGKLSASPTGRRSGYRLPAIHSYDKAEVRQVAAGPTAQLAGR